MSWIKDTGCWALICGVLIFVLLWIENRLGPFSYVLRYAFAFGFVILFGACATLSAAGFTKRSIRSKVSAGFAVLLLLVLVAGKLNLSPFLL